MRVTGPGMVVVDRLWVFLLYSLLPPMCCNKAENLKVPLLQLTHTELMSRNNSAMFNDDGRGAAYQALLLNEDHGWLLIGGRDHIYMLSTDNFTQPANKIHWPADQEHIERCKFAGKNLLMDCANYVRLLQPFNKTHVYVCGTGAFYPQCTYIELGLNLEKPTFWLLDNVRDSGKGKCPFSPKEPFTARLTDGNLYAGISVDFMGTNPAICRTSLHGGSQHYIRSEGYQDQWLNEPEFVGSFSIHDTHSLDDDKVYFFFKETAVESNQLDKRIFSRVARVCKNDIGGKRSLINRWSTFLKARLVCSHPGPEGIDTHFDELQDIFLLETKDPQNPVIYGLFSTSSSVFRGSAVCVYSMASVRAAFNGPFAHKEGSDYRWTEYKGRIPYPRPGTCPSETYDPLHKSTRDFPDEVVSFMRTHQLMWEPVMPVNRRPIYTMIDSPYSLNKLVVDRVHREHGQYDVLHLGTDDGKILKVVSVYRDGMKTEEIFLEELQVFKTRTPILSMELSTKRQVVFVSSDAGVVRLPLQRCALYGTLCVDCLLSRDPYCAWDGTSCTKHFPTSKRVSRRQDVRYREPWRQCEDLRDAQRAELKTVYGLEGSSTFLDCSPPSPQAKITWTIQSGQNIKNKVFSEDERVIHMGRGLLLRHITPASAGLYQCDAHDFSFTRTLAYYQLHVIPQHRISKAQDGPRENCTTLAQSRREVRVSRKKADEYCRQLWYHRQHGLQKVQMLKWKHVSENRKGRVRRHDANAESSDAWQI